MTMATSKDSVLYAHAKPREDEILTARAALGAFLLSGGEGPAWALLRAVPVNAFPEPLHEIAHAIHRLAASDGPAVAADIVALTTELAGVVPAAEIAALPDAVPTSANLGHYCAALSEIAAKRSMFNGLRPVLGDFRSPEKSAAEIAARLRDAADTGDIGSDTTGKPEDIRRWMGTEPPPPDFVLGDLVIRGIVAALCGAGGIGKSFWLLMVAVYGAVGRSPWPGIVAAPPRPMRTVLLFSEDPPAEVHRRFNAILRAGGFTDAERELITQNVTIICGEARPVLTKQFGAVVPGPGFTWLRDLCRTHRPDLLVLDPLSRFSGSMDENDNAGASALITLLMSRLATPMGLTVLLAHHVNKSDGGPRGASALVDGARWVATLAPMSERDCQRFDIAPDTARRFPALTVSKGNHRPDSYAPIFFQRLDDGLLGAADLRGDRLQSMAEIISKAMPEPLSSRQLEREPEGEHVRAALKAAFPRFSRAEIMPALIAGKAAGILDTGCEWRGPKQVPTTVWKRGCNA